MNTVTLVSSDCPEDLCDAVYNDVFTVLRADEGDVISPLSGQTCSKLKANCMGDSCHACKCPASKDTFNNHKEKCDDFSNGKCIFCTYAVIITLNAYSLCNDHYFIIYCRW